MKRILPVVVALAAFAADPGAQRGRPPIVPDPPQPVFRSSVELVHLDVSVLDRNRRPVRDLAPADFTILEDGRPQTIALFNAVNIPDPAPPAAPWTRDVAPEVRDNAGIQERRLFLILIDDATFQADLHMLRNVKDIGRKIVDRLGPSDLAAVVFTRDNRHSQDYTADRARLLRALDHATVGFRDMAPTQIAGADHTYFVYSANVVQSAVTALSSLPDRRKSIIYVGQGIPLDMDLLSEAAAPGLPANGGTSALSAQGLVARIKNQMLDTFEQAARANVNIYTADACGLRVPPGPQAFPVPTCVPGLEMQYLQTLSENTGARAVIESNDFGPGVSAIFEENASYYLLGYHSTNPRQDGRLRRLEVKVNRPGVEVRTRSGYRADKTSDVEKRRKALAESPLGVALAGLLPVGGLPLQATAVAFPSGPGKDRAAVAIAVGVRQPLRESAGRTVEKVDLQVSAFDVEGKAFGTARMRADVTIRAGATGLAEYEVLSKIELKPGRYQLRIAAHASSLAASGSLYYDVDVPDFRAEPMTLSGLVLTASPGIPVAPRDALKAVLPVLPTTRRAFQAGDDVTAFLRAFQGGRRPLQPMAVRVELRNDRDVIVMQRAQELPVAQFDASERWTNVLLPIPVRWLPPGEYLLTVTTGSIRRDCRFSIID